MKKYLFSFLAMLLVLSPFNVLAETDDKQPTTYDKRSPEILENGKYFAANGTAITIDKDNDGQTVATWEADGDLVKEVLNEDVIVIGGFRNPCELGMKCEITVEETSITMNDGKVNTIIAGNFVTQINDINNMDDYISIKVESANVTINGGEVLEVLGVTGEKYSHPNGPSTYDRLDTYYSIKNLNMNIKNVDINDRIALTFGYTHVKNAVINLENITIENNFGFMGGTNGKIENLELNVKDSNMKAISSGQRAMIDNFKVNVTGESNVGEIYMGSFYNADEYSNQSFWNNFGLVNYGLVNKMDVTVEKDSTYKNIYAGFQFVEYDKFEKIHGDNEKFGVVTGNYTNPKNSEVNVEVYSLPTDTTTTLKTILSLENDNHTFVYRTEENGLPEIGDSEKIEKPTITAKDKVGIDKILSKTISDIDAVRDAIKTGKDVSVKIDSKQIVDKDDLTKLEEDFQKEYDNTVIKTFFDINVLYKIGRNAEVKIPELSEKITLTVAVPEEYEEEELKEGMTRKYFMIREHNGTYEKLEATKIADGRFTFETDKFSTYALAYEDITNPDTKDNIMVYAIATLTSLAALFIIKKKLASNN